MPQRRLALKRETLSGLDSGDLRSVAGGTHVHSQCHCTHTCPPPTYECTLRDWYCITRLLAADHDTATCG